MQYTRGKVGIIYSDDGSAWEESNLIFEYDDKAFGEISGAWCGDNRIIALIRDDERKHGHPFVQIESYDNGQTWTEPLQSNIPPDLHWGAAPQVIYDRNRDLLIALSSDRYSRPNDQNSLFIFTARPDDVFGNPNGWTLEQELPRPWAEGDFGVERPLNQNLYGYPAVAPVSENEYLVVFTERAVMQGREQADLFYFKMVIE